MVRWNVVQQPVVVIDLQKRTEPSVFEHAVVVRGSSSDHPLRCRSGRQFWIRDRGATTELSIVMRNDSALS